MKTLKVSEFRSQCLTLMKHLPDEGVVITKRGKPVARLVPFTDAIDNSWMFGALKGKLKIKGDIRSTGIQWDAES